MRPGAGPSVRAANAASEGHLTGGAASSSCRAISLSGSGSCGKRPEFQIQDSIAISKLCRRTVASIFSIRDSRAARRW